MVSWVLLRKMTPYILTFNLKVCLWNRLKGWKKKWTVDANSPTAVIHTVMRRYIVFNYQNLLCSDPGWQLLSEQHEGQRNKSLP